jgi:hypothetical protein
MFFGMGIGILAMVAISFVTYIVQRTVYLNEHARLAALLEEHEAAAANPVDSLYVIDRARSLGMVFLDEIEPETVLHASNPIGDEYTDQVYNAYYAYDDGYEDYTEPDEPDVTPPEGPAVQAMPQPTPEGTRQIWRAIIPDGITASHVASEFALRGLVDDADDFLQFLVDRGYQFSVLAGTHDVPRGASFEEIANIIVHGNQ